MNGDPLTLATHDAVRILRRGMIMSDEAAALLDFVVMASRLSPLVVEVGTAAGKTARMIAQFAAANRLAVVVLTIDPVWHRGCLDEDPTLVGGRVVRFKGTSLDVLRAMALAPGLVFVDGCHCRPCVLGDLRAWAPIVARGGFLLFHDVTKDGTLIPRGHADPRHAGRACGVSAAIADGAPELAAYELVGRFADGHMTAYRRAR